ncbi:MAG: LysR substrate-binding domain-containing protein [Betaproteobacteria bacterium]
MDLDAVGVFVKVVQAGSFGRAARQLAMPNSTVSARVSRLERRLGVTLLQRTTRTLRLTEAGESYFRLAAQAIDELLTAEAQVNAAQAEPQGALRVTAPGDIATDWFAELTCEFKRQYPKVDLEFVFADQLLDLVAEGIDVAIRAGQLKDSRLVARRIGTAYWMAFASPSYLKAAGAPTHPRQLRNYSLLQFTKLGREHWRLTRGKSAVSVPVPHSLLVNDAMLVKRLAVAGSGIAMLPLHLCRADVRAGALVRVLPEWEGKADPVHLVYSGRKFVAAKVRAFVDFAAGSLKPVFQEG